LMKAGGNPVAWSEEDADYFRDLFLPQTSVTGGGYGTKEPGLGSVFELHFVDRYSEYFEWIAFCIEVNFKRFFEEAAARKTANATSANE
jgi:hypothetical protein